MPSRGHGTCALALLQKPLPGLTPPRLADPDYPKHPEYLRTGYNLPRGGKLCDTAHPMERKCRFEYDELLDCARGNMFGMGNAQLPLPPILMFDRITDIDKQGGRYQRGQLQAELDIRPDMWFFDCHFSNDPVMPGCLGLDAMWQLLGFYLSWTGAPGRGRALGTGTVKFSGQVTPENRLMHYTVHVKRVINRKLVMGLADAEASVDGKPIYVAQDLRVGLFTQPMESPEEKPQTEDPVPKETTAQRAKQ